MKILIYDTDIEIHNKKEISNVIDMTLRDKMFIKNLVANNNWTGQSISGILKTIKEYVISL